MIFHENRLLSFLISFEKFRKDVENLSSAAVVIGALRVNLQDSSCTHIFSIRVENSVDPDQMASSEAS